MRINNARKEGNAAIVIVILVLLAGAAWFFLFREVPEPQLPGAGTPGQPAKSDPAAETVMAKGAVADVREESIGAVTVSPGSSPLPMTEAGEVDWTARRSQLEEKYSGQFSEPKIGMNAKVLLRSGRTVEGRINDLTGQSVTLRITGTGKATYQRSQLSPASQLVLFKDVFVNYSAEKQLTAEKAAHQAATPAVPQ